MAIDLEATFPRPADRAVIANPRYQAYDWDLGHRLSFPTVEVTFGFDGFQELAEDAAYGRAVRAWRERNPDLAALLDAEQTVDVLAGAEVSPRSSR